MESLEKQAKSAVAALGKRSKTSRVPANVREIVLDYAREQRAAGVSWRDIATTVGLSSVATRSSCRISPASLAMQIWVCFGAPFDRGSARKRAPRRERVIGRSC
jgi:hypothetical protein